MHSLASNLSKQKTIPSLDGIRAVSIIIVALAHSGFGHIIPGGLGVTVFFFLSGYLITTLLIVEYQKYQTIHLKKFFIRRFLRLSPPFICTLITAYLLVYFEFLPGKVQLEGIVAQVFYFANYYAIFFVESAHLPSGTGIFWSLAVEEHFYLIFPLIFLVIISTTKHQQFSLLLIGLCLCVLLWRIYLVSQHGASEVRIYYATDTRIDSIVYGCLLAITKNPMSNMTENQKFTVNHIFILLVSLSLILLSILIRDESFRNTFRYSLQGIALMPIFFFAIQKHNHILFRPLSNKLLVKIGQLSYSVYLIHHILIYLMTKYFTNTPTLIVFFIIFLISIIYAYMLDKYIESPIRRIKQRFH